jgi:hypothetical protein
MSTRARDWHPVEAQGMSSPAAKFTAMASDEGSACGSISARALMPGETGDDGVEFIGERS